MRFYRDVLPCLIVFIALIAVGMLIALVFGAISPYPSADKRGLMIARGFFTMPMAAHNQRASPFSEGQWRSNYVKFDLPQIDLDDFLTITCLESGSYADAYSPEVNLTQYRGAPDWWLSKSTPLLLKGRCQPPSIFAVGVANNTHDVTIYIMMFW